MGEDIAQAMLEIDLALKQLDELVAEAVRDQSRWGYFAALRRRITRCVRTAHEEGRFEGSERTLKFECCLLGQYFRALEAYRKGGVMSQSWEIVFSATEQAEWSRLQHLLMGVAVHHYLDFGICAAETMRGADYATLDGDFATLTDLVFEALTCDKLNRACGFAPWFGVAIGQPNVWLARQARGLLDESTWEFGLKLSEMDPAYWAATIAARDSSLVELCWAVMSPGFPSNWLIWCGRQLECSSIGRGIAKLG